MACVVWPSSSPLASGVSVDGAGFFLHGSLGRLAGGIQLVLCVFRCRTSKRLGSKAQSSGSSFPQFELIPRASVFRFSCCFFVFGFSS